MFEALSHCLKWIPASAGMTIFLNLLTLIIPQLKSPPGSKLYSVGYVAQRNAMRDADIHQYDNIHNTGYSNNR